MPKTLNPNLLLVEGKVEKRVIPQLIEKNGIVWEPQKGVFCVEIAETDGVENPFSTYSPVSVRSILDTPSPI